MEKTIRKSTIFKGPFFTLRDHLVKLVGKEKRDHRFVLEHPGAVAIVAVLPGDRIVLVRQFRKAIERETWELPAGKIDPKEAAIQTAQRELMEETGFQANSITHLLSYHPSPGLSNEVIHIYVSHDLTEVTKHGADEDVIRARIFTRNEVERMIQSQLIWDSKTILGVWALKLKELSVAAAVNLEDKIR